MKICLINGSIQDKNNASIVTAAVKGSLVSEETSIVSLKPFSTLFTGTYIYFDSANAGQQRELQKMIEADILLFIVPTYYKSMPGGLKNFFDIVKCSEAYANKIIGIIASNHKNQDYGARHAEEVLKGISIFFNIKTILIPEILIQHHEHIDHEEIDRYLRVAKEYAGRRKHDEASYKSLTAQDAIL